MNDQFRGNPTITAMVEALFRACAGLERGDMLTHEVSREIIGADPGEDRWRYCLKKLADRMEDERGITIWSEPGVGYRLLTEWEQIVFVAKKRALKARRQYAKARKSVRCLPDEGLTDRQLMAKQQQEEGLRLAQARLAEDARRQEAINRPYQGLPRPIAV